MAVENNQAPTLSLPKGGGAVNGIGETFQPDLFTGTGNFSIPISVSPGRNGFGPQLNLEYSSGNGNSPFGLGWKLSLARVTRKSQKGLPRYNSQDTFIISGTEDLVPHLKKISQNPDNWQLITFDRSPYSVTCYRPRTEGDFARIEQWTHTNGDMHWRAISKNNVTSVYGFRSAARIADPQDSHRVYEWLLEETFDEKGNHIRYEYAREATHEAQLYLRRIFYGNSRQAVGQKRRGINHQNAVQETDRHYLFEVLFDYFDLTPASNDPYISPASNQDIINLADDRPDPFSNFRPSFELKMSKRCRRVLMFHHFTELGGPTLVKSTDFEYETNSDNLFSFLKNVHLTGYTKSGSTYLSKQYPPIALTYSKFEPEQKHYQNVSAPGDEMPALSFQDPDQMWLDLSGNAFPDALHTSANLYQVWKNHGQAVLDRPRPMVNQPTGVVMSQSHVKAGDHDGDSVSDLVVTAPLKGVYETDRENGWKDFRLFESFPSVELDDEHLRFVDLTGDGLPDMIVSLDHHFLWYQNLGEKGYGEPRHIERIYDLDSFPDLQFQNSTEKIEFADMTGDGLSDLVYVHDGRIDYWPNQGYGSFGEKVTMKNAPQIGFGFDPNRLFLVDLDGSGCADIVYVAYDHIRFWFNRSGNSWSHASDIHGTPPVTNMDHIQFVDLFGSGTSTLVWSYNASRYPGKNIKVLDFCAGGKPYLLTGMSNNLGAETQVYYAPSTKYYLEDEKNGRPWVTKLPIAIHCVDRVEVIDHISQSKLVTQYKYHHGYYDTREKEFRGFGCVEQLDAETFDLSDPFRVPPVLTKTWFHTGTYFDGEELQNQFRKEFYQGDATAFPLPDFDVDVGQKPKEAYRALRGSMIRTEVYALDGTNKEKHPYSVDEITYHVKMLQPALTDSGHAAFLPLRQHSVNYHYERNPDDPRIGHQISLDVDDFGNVTKSCVIGYPRRNPAFLEQGKTLITFVESDYANVPEHKLYYMVAVPYGARTYELTEVPRAVGQLYSQADILNAFGNATNIPYEKKAMAGVLEKRIVEGNRILYYKNDLSGPLNLGQVESLLLKYETYTMAFTPQLIQDVFGDSATNNVMHNEGGYQLMDGFWWTPSGKNIPNAAHMFQVEQYVDPFQKTHATRYDQYDLLMEETIDPSGNSTKSKNDYRVLQTWEMTGPNGNRTQVAFDRLGLVAATAVMGKTTESVGDSLATLIKDLSQTAIDVFFADPAANSSGLLKKATRRHIYDIHRFIRTGEPNVVSTLTRDTHDSDSSGSLHIQNSLIFIDGFGRNIQRKAFAENTNWRVTGWQVFNHKGNPVKQYEPFFSTVPTYQDASTAIQGKAATLFYDPLDRVVLTLHSNHSYEKNVIGTWKQENWDLNDTVLMHDPKTDVHVGAFFARLSNADYLPTWYKSRDQGQMGTEEKIAAEKTAKHANTPMISHLDTLGREFLKIADNGSAGKYETRIEIDIEGNDHAIKDPRNIEVFKHRFNMLSRKISIESRDAGKRLILPNVQNQTIYAEDEEGNKSKTVYDAAGRLIENWVSKGSGAARLAEKTIYGDSLGPNAAQFNHRGKIYQTFDGAGLFEGTEYDFKGNMRKSKRQLLKAHQGDIDWNVSTAGSLLSNDVFEMETTYDANNRVKSTKSPDQSTYFPTYNEAGLIDSVQVALRGESNPANWISFVTNIDYNAREQREKIEYGNGAFTDYEYDAHTFRLTRLTTKKGNKTFQKLNYTYDPSGNVMHLEDKSQRAIYFNNQVVTPSTDYEYDAIYRLILAEGREHGGQGADLQRDQNDFPIQALSHTNDLKALRLYKETYAYDEAGNFIQMAHQTIGSATGNWTRHYDRATTSNRLMGTSLPSDAANQYSTKYKYDDNGNIKKFPHLGTVTWDFKNQMTSADLGGGGHVYYQYDQAGKRVRKVIENASGQKVKERI
ncbi:insecticidal toxin complex protein [Candidatus Scalindua japonica]|uniref:Insecticidal toxin complex protein n=1 Tax=Candidatus Scalindua japonica TaxID=1284222 RepID=A0A286U0B2_9BACT|nr:SpvB/TcaC N-terminal domain-containing protein [Candidatus Scalindua japonica]GAX61566.1 insecticidal toxin complex protein [Candidatus Scalindua japonica]